MRHPHHRAYSFSPGRHRSGFFFILLLVFLSEVRGLPLHDRLKEAMQMYFSQHPEFHPEDTNEGRVRSLIHKNLEGQNSHELAGLAAAMDDEPLYQEFLAKLQAPQPGDPPASSSEDEEEA